jgi:hypothetical protein
MRMNSLDAGVTPPRTVRIPTPVWDRLTAWAEASGVGDAEALRMLLDVGLDTAPPITPLRPPRKWMTAVKGVDRSQWLMCAVTSGNEWWTLDDVLGSLEGARPVDYQSPFTWRMIPRDQMDALREIFAGRPNRLRMHRMD